MWHSRGWACLYKSDMEIVWGDGSVCMCVCTMRRPAHSWMRTPSLILLKEDSVGRVAAPQSSCSPRRDTSDTLYDPHPSTLPPFLLVTRSFNPPPHPSVTISSAFSTFARRLNFPSLPYATARHPLTPPKTPLSLTHPSLPYITPN